jgi:hypothetical protein
MVFWQLTIDANHPAVLARFWAQALGYQPAPPAEPQTTWHAHYRARLGEDAAFGDRLRAHPGSARPTHARTSGSAASLTGQTTVACYGTCGAGRPAADYEVDENSAAGGA